MYILVSGARQIMWALNELCVKLDLSKVMYFYNTRSKVGGLVYQLTSYFCV